MNKLLVVALGIILSSSAFAGDLDSSGAPSSGSNMPTLTEIYNQLDTGATSSPAASFQEPAAGPTAGTGKSLTEIKAKLPAPDNTNGAVLSDVRSGKTFWGLNKDGGAWGLQTGNSHIASLVCQAGWLGENCDIVDKCVGVTCPTKYGKILTCSYLTGVCSNPLEVCDGLDNDGNGVIDDDAVGTNLACRSNVGVCTPGVTMCVGGAIVCSGGISPQPEVCDGKDNDCNGIVDDGPLYGAPAVSESGCWDLPGNCCSFTDAATGQTTSWCAPTGATCNGLGSLSLPNSAGTLVCGGTSGWQCQGAQY